MPLNRGKTPRLTANFRRFYEDESDNKLALLALEEVNEYIFITNMHNKPSTYKQAINGIDRKHWLKAMQEEVQELVDSNTWRLVNLPKGRIALGGRWVYKLKTDSNGNIVRYKARWVVQGFNQVLGIDYLETYSTTCRPECYRLFLLIAMASKWVILQYDIQSAFTHARIDREIYVIQPTRFAQGTKVCLLLKALYGLKQSPRLWYKHLKEELEKEGFTAFPFDEGIFIHQKYSIILVCHVDDFYVTGPNQAQIDQVMENLGKRLKIKFLGAVSDFLGNEIALDYENQTVYIHQTKYTQKILEKYHKLNAGIYGVTTPCEPGIKLRESKQNATKEEIKRFQQEIGSLLYLSLKTRPDITFAVQRCSRYSKNPDKDHFKALQRIWQYLVKYPDLGLYYKCKDLKNNFFIKNYCDSDWANDLDNRSSTEAYISCLGSAPINWKIKLQTTTATSSTEAEYMALKGATQESIYLLNMLHWL